MAIEGRRNSLGEKLRETRKLKGIHSPNKLSEMMNKKYSVSGILKRERGEIKISHEYVDTFCSTLSLTEKEKKDLFLLTDLFLFQFDPWKKGKSLSVLHDEFLERLLHSRSFKNYDSMLIPGLLQTHSYSYAVLSLAGIVGKEAEEIAKKRQEIAVEIKEAVRRGLEIKIIIAESALYNTVGSALIMREQLLYLKQHEYVGIQYGILPNKTLCGVSKTNNFLIFDNLLVTSETPIGAIHSGDTAIISDMNERFDNINSFTEFGEQKHVLIERALPF